MFALIYLFQETVQYFHIPSQLLEKMKYSSPSHPVSGLLIKSWKDLAFSNFVNWLNLGN